MTRVLLGVTALLVAGTLLRAARLGLRPNEIARKRWRSIGTWWLLLALMVLMLTAGPWGVLAVMAVLSALALRESLSLADGPGPRAVALGLLGPVFTVAVAWWPPRGLAIEPLAPVVLLLILTELNDIAQAWWGRTVGAHAMAPVLSPNKTWEGFWGGLVTTTAMAALLAPALLWLDSTRGALAGIVVAVGGVAGDLTASRLKRAAGADDSGALLPGQGGVVDRLDSLTVTAPAFFGMLWAIAWTF